VTNEVYVLEEVTEEKLFIVVSHLRNQDIVQSCLRHDATSWKVAGLNPDEVIGFFN
jgi:hypothetical protein